MSLTPLTPTFHGQDQLNGEEGDDRLFGLGGADTLMGGEGDDYLQGDLAANFNAEPEFQGADLLDGGEGNESFEGDMFTASPESRRWRHGDFAAPANNDKAWRKAA